MSLIRRVTRLLAAALLLTPWLSACVTTNPATGKEDFTPFMSPAEERRVGAEEHPKMLAQFGGVYDDPAVGGYVASIGGRLAAHSERPDLDFRFTVLNSPVINAFALPGGYVYISRGLMALANSEAELASVLAHEIGHVTARHSAQRYNQSIFLGVGTAILGAVVGSSVFNQVANIGGELYLKGYSRDQEHQADDLGIRYLRGAGYDTAAAAQFLRSLQADSELKRRIAGAKGKDPLADIFATHPRTADRVERAAAAAGGGNGAPRLRSRFMDEIDGMIFGDDPAEGLVREQTFWHPNLGFTFTVPDGFKLVNTRKAVFAVAKNGAKIRFDSSPDQWNGGVMRYISDRWAAKLRLRDLEPIEINGMRAATAVSEVISDRKKMDLRLVAVRFDRRTIFRFLFMTPPRLTSSLDLGFRRTAFGFRRMTDDEKVDIRPQRIRLVPVRAGDTAESFSQRMQVRERPLELFRVLNGLRPGQKIQPGQRVKIVVN